MAQLKVTILGCGSSGGVPRLGGHWGACDPNNPKNRRTRCSILVEKTGPKGTTSVLIDTSPDMRQQLLTADVGRLDGVVYTHAHADHTHGIDDLRMIVINMGARLPVWADAPTRNDLMARFGYAFETPENSKYPPILDLHAIDGEIRIEGAGGTLAFSPFSVTHGNIDALGFRFEDIAYLPDVSEIPQDIWPKLEGLKCWIVDALRRAPHPSHSHLAQTLEWIDKANCEQAILTNMHNDLDYTTLLQETPAHIQPAFDGMTLNF